MKKQYCSPKSKAVTVNLFRPIMQASPQPGELESVGDIYEM